MPTWLDAALDVAVVMVAAVAVAMEAVMVVVEAVAAEAVAVAVETVADVDEADVTTTAVDPDLFLRINGTLCHAKNSNASVTNANVYGELARTTRMWRASLLSVGHLQLSTSRRHHNSLEVTTTVRNRRLKPLKSKKLRSLVLSYAT